MPMLPKPQHMWKGYTAVTGCKLILFLTSSMKFALHKSDGKLYFYDPSILWSDKPNYQAKETDRKSLNPVLWWCIFKDRDKNKPGEIESCIFTKRKKERERERERDMVWKTMQKWKMLQK